MKKLWILLALAMTAMLPAPAQNGFKVSGLVTDKNNGQPLPGVTVSVAHTPNGTATDSLGRHSLQVKDGSASLRFTLIGYEREEIKVKNSRAPLESGTSAGDDRPAINGSWAGNETA